MRCLLLSAAVFFVRVTALPSQSAELAKCLLTLDGSYWESQTSVRRSDSMGGKVTQRFLPDSTGWIVRLDMPGYGREAFTWFTGSPDSLVVFMESGTKRVRRVTCTSEVLTFHFGLDRYRWYRQEHTAANRREWLRRARS